MSGPAGPNLRPIVDGVQVWVRAVNDRGGVNGHPIRQISGDDGADPSRHRALVQEFVEQRKVIALVGNPEALSGQTSVEYMTRVGVPVIGSETAGQWFYESPVYFPQASHGFALIQAAIAGWAIESVRAGRPRLASITCVEVQVCRDSNRVGPQVARRYGAEVVSSAQASFSQPDYTAECLSARNAGAQSIGMAMDGNSVSRIAASCARQGYHPTFNFTNAIISPQHAKDPNLENSILIINVAPWMLTNTPALKEFSDAMARYAPGVEKTASHITGWIAAKLFEAGAQKLSDPPTAAALVAGLWATSGSDLGGLTGPLKFTPHKPATPTACWFNASIRNGHFVSPDNGRRQCIPYDPSVR